MYSGCFGCSEIIEGDDADVVVARFLVHSSDSHDWEFPEEALKNYARNYAEATVRLTGSSERLPEIGEVTVQPVSGDRIDDWLEFFDHAGFVGNPDWASCYCLEPHVAQNDEMPERPWKVNRDMIADRLRTGGTSGYLAYVDGIVAGWVNASLSADTILDSLSVSEGTAAENVIAVACFVIAPPFRRHGVAAALLDRVILDAPGRGAAWVEGFPNHNLDEGDPGYFRGPLALFESRGFQLDETRDHHSVVRLRV